MLTRPAPEFPAFDETRKFRGTRQRVVDSSRRTIHQNKIWKKRLI